MKKALLFLASAALLLVGCAKEKFAEPIDGGMTSVTFSARVDGGVATKAASDYDGNGAYVNRCIMEIYFQDELYTRLVQPVTPAAGEAKAYATFANVPVVAGKEYQILFWADCGGAEKSDLYYTTTSLKAVTVAKTAFIGALVAGDNDKLDAFFFTETRSIPQSGDNSYTVSLKRPFAQLNVITTDINKTVTSAALLPDKVSVSYKADNILNVATGETSRSETEADYTFTYEAPVYGVWSDTKSELTLSMDYILASTEQAAVDVTFKTFNNGDANPVMTHNLTNLPYKRNYRTNVKGDLLTAAGTWTATIDPIWSSPDIVKVVEVADIKSANQIINQYASTTANLEVKFVGVPNDSGVPSGSEGSQYRAIRTTPLQEGANLGIEVMTSTNTLYVGDYIHEYKVTGGTVAEYIDNTAKQATVNINVPQNSGIGTLIINAPSKTVLVNGKLVSNVGTITNIDAITSQNTLIIEPGQNVTKLTMRQGGLEIHGTVNTLVINENAHEANPVKVRTSENLSQEVFDVIYKAGEDGHDYIDRPDYDSYSYKVGEETRWNIVPVVCKIGDKGFASIKNAVASVTDSSPATIIMVSSNVENITDGSITIPAGKNITLDLNGKEVSAFSANGSNSFFVNNGELTVKDSDSAGKGKLTYGAEPTWEWGGEIGHYEGSYASNLFKNSGTLTLKNGNYYNMASGSACYIIDLYGSSYAKVENGYYYAVSTNFRNNCGTNTLEIFDGKFEAEGYNVNNHGNQSDSNVLKIHGGHFSTTSSYNIYSVWNDSSAPTNCKVFIDGGEFEGYVMVDYIKDVDETGQKNVIISGGKFWYFYDYRSGVKSITGGIHTYIDENWVVDGYKVVDNTDADTKAQYPWKVIEDVKPVDLGLSVIWGDRNVNAASIFEKGDYFAWGETVARADAGDWGLYKYYDESSNTNTKYNTTDQIYVLKPEDDAASANLGDGWRMPTKAEMEELLNCCSYEKTSNYQGSGVNGLLFTAQNGQTLFIPASGNIWDQLYNPTTEVCFWCADKPTTGSAKAYALDYISNLIDKDTGFSRCGLMPIRPVKSK